MNQLMLKDCLHLWDPNNVYIHICKHYWDPKDVRSFLTLNGS